MKRTFRKPLILMTPKSLLRDKLASSPVQDFVAGRFHEILDDPSVEPGQVRRVVLCSGKVYYDLLKERMASEVSDVALVRVEQFYPFPEEYLTRVLSRYRKAREWVWAQEESLNNGGWFFVEPRLRAINHPVQYVGRDASASPATGSHPGTCARTEGVGRGRRPRRGAARGACDELRGPAPQRRRRRRLV